MPAGRRKPATTSLADSSRLGAVIELLDEVFVRSQDRALSVASRYPHLLREPDDGVRIFVAPSADDVQAVVLSRSFDWIRAGDRWRGVMVGLVATHPTARGHGLASALLENARRSAVADGADLAVLWTGNSGFYQRLGWIEGDVGLLGELSGRGPAVAQATVPEKLNSAAVEWVEAVRARFVPHRIERDAASYEALPAPAERLELYRLSADRGDAYALAGRAEGLSVLYELVGEPACFQHLWSSIRQESDEVLINGAPEDVSTRWLQELGGIAWQQQRLAMWLPLSEAARSASITSWHVPFFDRI